VLTPGTYDWVDTIPVALVAALVLLVPGAVTLLLLRCRPVLALTCGPAVSTMVVVLGGSVAAVLRVPWGLVPLLASTGAAWLLAVALRVGLDRWVPGPAGRREAVVAPGRAWLVHLATAAGVLFAFTVVATVLTTSSGSPEAFPQHPDTIFHLGTTQWMAEHRDVSFQHGMSFFGRALNVSYPVGFHSVAATVSLLTGVPAVVAISALVLVAAGLVWPLGMAALTRTSLDDAPAAGAVGAVTSVLFLAFPFMLMGFGVLWPNLFGQVLLAGPLAAFVLLARFLGGEPSTRRVVATTTLAVVLAVPGLGLAHPSALFALALLGGAALWFGALRRGRGAPSGTAGRWRSLVVMSGLLVLAVALSTLSARGSMLLTGEAGPEMSWGAALRDLAGFGPRWAAPKVYVLGVAAILGLVVIAWVMRRAAWAAAGLVVFSGLYLLNTAVDTELVRHLTWPWYNNAIRLAAAGVVPAAVVVAAAVVGAARLVARRARRPWTELVVTALLLGLLVVPSRAWVGRDVDWLRPYFHPGVARSWASPEELRALHALAKLIPPGSTTAADPWKGGTYLYVVGDRRLFIPTEKANTSPETRLVGLELDQVGSNPEVCRIARENSIDFALTGGVPFLWGVGRSRSEYPGIAGVAGSPYWEKVAAEGPYTLYRRVACAE
jgi:hypothetical protein